MTEKEYFKDFTQGIFAGAGAEENFTRTTFIERMCSLMEDDGYISGFELTEHKISSRGQAIDAWSFDDERSCLTLFIADHRNSTTLESLTNTEISVLFKRLKKFLEASLRDGFPESLEESDPVAGLVWMISQSKEDISRLNLVVLSNARLSLRVADLPRESIAGFETGYDVWDFGRIYRSETSGKSREDIEIDFDSLAEKGLPCLPAYTGEGSVQTYLLVMPGRILADLYETYGERLLEQNVRTFLQFRGNINKGMRNTIVNEPEMFFSYNNGLSATAETVKTTKSNDRLLSVKNLQIVNGGQTTASIFTAHKKEKANLDNVYVQVKLSVIGPEKVETVVPLISEYSNTQNKVSAADFFSNHPFHLRFEEHSRRIWAPSAEGLTLQTHWFYERARGQFANQQANLTPTKKKEFLAQNPRNQMVTKTDLAKYILSFDEEPHRVSLGAQKAFAGSPRVKGFVGKIAVQWEKSAGLDFNEVWFKRAIAMAIFFRQLDSHIRRQPWYAQYKAQLVTYTLAKFSSMVRKLGRNVDFLSIWNEQKLPGAVMQELGEIAEIINDILQHPPEGSTSNVSEWAKKPECWAAVESNDVPLGPELLSILIEADERRERDIEGTRTQVIQDEIQSQTYVVEKGAPHWEKLREWNNANRKLSPREMGILNIACSIPKKFPTEKQAPILIQAEARAKAEGFFVEE